MTPAVGQIRPAFRHDPGVVTSVAPHRWAREMRDSGFRVSQCSAQKRVIGQVPVDFCYWIAGGRLSGRIAWRLRKARLPWLVAEGSLARSASLHASASRLPDAAACTVRGGLVDLGELRLAEVSALGLEDGRGGCRKHAWVPGWRLCGPISRLTLGRLRVSRETLRFPWVPVPPERYADRPRQRRITVSCSVGWRIQANDSSVGGSQPERWSG